MVQLDKRLARMAELMTPGGVGIDVGADHGYLSVSLVASGKAKRMLATDIRPGPLSSAERCIRENGLQDRIGTMLTDGLNGVPLEGATDILIGGMGGLLIAGILQARLPELKEFNLVLQPMTQAAIIPRHRAIPRLYHTFGSRSSRFGLADFAMFRIYSFTGIPDRACPDMKIPGISCLYRPGHNTSEKGRKTAGSAGSIQSTADRFTAQDTGGSD